MEILPPDHAPADLGAAETSPVVAASPFARLRVRALAGWTLVFGALAVVILALVERRVLHKLDPRLLVTVLTAVLVLPMYVVGQRAGVRWRRIFGAPLRRGDLPLTTAVLPVALTTMASVYLLYAPLSYVAPDYVRRVLLDNRVFDVETVGQWLLLALGGAVFAPVLEELLFRGLIMQRWAYRWGTRTGVMASSALFAVGHGEWVGHFVFGVVMSLLYLRTRRLWVPILAHGIHNLTLMLSLLGPAISHAHPEPPETLASFRAGAWAGFPVLCAALVLGWMYLRVLWPAGSVRAALDGPVPYGAVSEDSLVPPG